MLTIHDVGGADRELYVVMELIDGAPVSRWRIEKRPGWRRIVDVYLQAGRGLVAAHQLGIVHRDIKPDNILVANNGRVLVGDFGLAGLAGSLTPGGDPSPAAPPSPGSLTQTGAVLGTPAYMSPEQHDGKTGDALSDQFSFAVSLYESLHGRRPFAGRSAGEIAAATRERAAGARRRRRPARHRSRAGDRADPDPIRRYASMEDLLRALERGGRPAPAAVWLAGAAVLLVAGAVGARLWMHRAPAPAGHPAPASASGRGPRGLQPHRRAPTRAADGGGHDGGAPRRAPSLGASDGTSGPSRHRRQVAQAERPGRRRHRPGKRRRTAPQPAAPVIDTQVQILARAEQQMYRARGRRLPRRAGRGPASGPRRSPRARRGPAATARCWSATATRGESCWNRATEPSGA